MGGLSGSNIITTEPGIGVFKGNVSLDNNGGFASVRLSLGETDLSSFSGLAACVTGQSKLYRLRLRTDNRFDGLAYQAKFKTTGDEWEIIEIPFESFIPTYRGRILTNVLPLNTARICQIGFMIEDKQSGPFRLEIA